MHGLMLGASRVFVRKPDTAFEGSIAVHIRTFARLSASCETSFGPHVAEDRDHGSTWHPSTHHVRSARTRVVLTIRSCRPTWPCRPRDLPVGILSDVEGNDRVRTSLSLPSSASLSNRSFSGVERGAFWTARSDCGVGNAWQPPGREPNTTRGFPPFLRQRWLQHQHLLGTDEPHPTPRSDADRRGVDFLRRKDEGPTEAEGTSLVRENPSREGSAPPIPTTLRLPTFQTFESGSNRVPRTRPDPTSLFPLVPTRNRPPPPLLLDDDWPFPGAGSRGEVSRTPTDSFAPFNGRSGRIGSSLLANLCGRHTHLCVVLPSRNEAESHPSPHVKR